MKKTLTQSIPAPKKCSAQKGTVRTKAITCNRNKLHSCSTAQTGGLFSLGPQHTAFLSQNDLALAFETVFVIFARRRPINGISFVVTVCWGVRIPIEFHGQLWTSAKLWNCWLLMPNWEHQITKTSLQANSRLNLTSDRQLGLGWFRKIAISTFVHHWDHAKALVGWRVK